MDPLERVRVECLDYMADFPAVPCRHRVEPLNAVRPCLLLWSRQHWSPAGRVPGGNQFVFIFIKWYYGWCELWPWPCGITTASLILVLLNLDFACELELGSHSFDCFYLAVDLWSWFQWLYPRPWPTQPETFWFLTASWACLPRHASVTLVLSKVLFLHSVMGTHLPWLS